MREGQSKLMDDYRKLQRQVIEWGGEVMPGYITLSEWRRGRKDAYSDRGNAIRLLQAGRVDGAVLVGGTWMVPKGAQPKPSPNAKYDPHQFRATSHDGVKL